MAIAIFASVTVSMAEAMIGRFSEIVLVSCVRMSTSAGMTSEGPGSSSTSSKVRPSRIRPSSIWDIVNSDTGLAGSAAVLREAPATGLTRPVSTGSPWPLDHRATNFAAARRRHRGPWRGPIPGAADSSARRRRAAAACSARRRNSRPRRPCGPRDWRSPGNPSGACSSSRAGRRHSRARPRSGHSRSPSSSRVWAPAGPGATSARAGQAQPGEKAEPGEPGGPAQGGEGKAVEHRRSPNGVVCPCAVQMGTGWTAGTVRNAWRGCSGARPANETHGGLARCARSGGDSAPILPSSCPAPGVKAAISPRGHPSCSAPSSCP